jgi:gallate dioxygenase
MARIIGAIASSHTPTIGFALDRNKQDDPVWAPIFEAYVPIRQWLAEKKPDALVLTYNDHVTSFFFDHFSAFALGVGETYPVADEGGGPRALPPVRGHAAFSHHIGASLMADEFDMSFFQDRALDHGWLSPLSMLLPHEPDWPVPIVPLQIGVLQFPVPTARRCYKLGHALRRAIDLSFPSAPRAPSQLDGRLRPSLSVSSDLCPPRRRRPGDDGGAGRDRGRRSWWRRSCCQRLCRRRPSGTRREAVSCPRPHS